MSSSSSKTLIKDLTVGSVPKQLLRFAAPLFLSGLLQTVYNLVDMIIVGQYIGSSGLSAVSIGGDVLHLLMFIAMGFSNAGQVIISQLIGAGQRERLSRLIGTLFSFLAICAVVLTIVCLFVRSTILSLLNAPVESWDYAMQYIVTCIVGLVFIYGYNLVSAILRGMGDSKHPFMFIAIAAVLNFILDMIFVAVFNWGVLGAALATVIGQAISFILALVFLYRHKEQFGFDFKLKSFAIDRNSLGMLVRLGIPMVLQSAAISFSKLFVGSYVNSYGVVASALTGIGNKLNTVSNVFGQALSTSGGAMIAQNIGAEKYDRVPKVLGTSFGVAAIVSAIMIFLTVVFPNIVFGLFTTDRDVLDMAYLYIPNAVLNYIGCIIRPPMMSLINGSGYSKMNLAIGLLDGFIMRIGLSMLLGLVFNLGIRGFWYGDSLSGFMPFFIGGVFFISGKWKTRRHIINEA